MSQELQTMNSKLLKMWYEAEIKHLKLRLVFAQTVIRIPKNRKNLPELLKKIQEDTERIETQYNELKQTISYL